MKDFFSKCDQILCGKLFLCSDLLNLVKRLLFFNINFQLHLKIVKISNTRNAKLILHYA